MTTTARETQAIDCGLCATHCSSEAPRASLWLCCACSRCARHARIRTHLRPQNTAGAMPRTGRKKAASKDGLGNALSRRQAREKHARGAAAAGGDDARHRPAGAPLESILDASDFSEMMENVARRESHTVANGQTLAPPTVVTLGGRGGGGAGARAAAAAAALEFDEAALRVPRRPAWGRETAREELEEKEEVAFLEWRRATAAVEERLAAQAGFGGAMLTPFEKNLHVWRQLWRVVERSDVVVQIVDARNPLLYYCPDLRRYAADEMRRTHVLVVNKADLLSSEMISRWEAYFKERGLEALFFSAFKASVNEQTDDARVLGAEELILKLHQYEHTVEITKPDQRVTIGFCGYPNVGKSSTINCLLETAAAAETAMLEAEEAASLDSGGSGGDLLRRHDDDAPPPGLFAPAPANPLADVAVGTIASTMNGFSTMTLKRVGVSSTPGKTKHFQTLVLSDRLLLCDCPGLVFPNFSASKAELICAGVLSIDSMRGAALPPISLLARRIPASIFEGVYGIRFPAHDGMGLMDVEEDTKPGHVSATTLLEVHARARGFMSDHDRADHSRSARFLLKQYVGGRILFAHAPPPAGPDEGQPGVGPDVHAKKGKLVRAREEAAAAGVAAVPEGPVGNTVVEAQSEAGWQASQASERREKVSASELHNVAAAAEAGHSGGAKLSRGKKHAAVPFTRVERSYYPNPHG